MSSVLFIQSVFRSTNSTAAVSLLFVPISAFVYAVPAFAAGWCLGYLLTGRPAREGKPQILMVVAALVLIGIAGATFIFFKNGHFLSQEVRQIQRMDAVELESVLNRPDLAHNKFVLGAVAQNPNATAILLHRIARLQRPDLQEPMGSVFDLLGRNTKGLAVMRLVAAHPHTAAEDLERLATGTNEYVLSDVAANPKLSDQTLWKLADQAAHGSSLIEWGLARNPKAPKDLLSKLARSGNDYTRAGVAANRQASAETLAALSKDRIWHVRQNAALNPNTPPTIVQDLLNDSDERVKRAATAGMGIK